MIKDENKQITNIVYNNMNLPIEIRINGMMGENQIHYIYTADGSKLRQFVAGQNEMGVDTKKFTDYIGNFVYINNTLAFILTPEGRITNNEAIKQFKHEYFIKDHLGNTRSVVDAGGNVLEEDSYYPFGMQIDALSSSSTAPENRYKYNGKELTSDFGLDWYEYGARFYDPVIARWSSVDPLAEDYLSQSPYNYVENRPIIMIDPTGEGGVITIKGNTITITSNLYLYPSNDKIMNSAQGTQYYDRIISNVSKATNGTFSITNTNTLDVYFSDGYNTTQQTYNIVYNVNINVISEDDATAMQLSDKNNPADNFFVVLDALPDGGSGKAVVGDNIGGIPLFGLEYPGNLMEEVWHTIVGYNYSGKSYNPIDKSHANRDIKDADGYNSICDGNAAGSKNRILIEDFDALFRAGQFGRSSVPKDQTKVLGNDANRMPTLDDLKK